MENGEHWSSLITRWRQNCKTVSADRLAVAESLGMYCPKMNILSSFTHAQCHSYPHIFCLLQNKKGHFSNISQAFLYTVQEKWMVIYADNSKKPGKYQKTVSYVIVSYSLFFQSVNAINLRFKGQHNWLSKLNRFYFIYWSLVSGPITIHIQTTNQKYEK